MRAGGLASLGWVLGLALLGAFAAPARAAADPAHPGCDAPAYMLSTGITLGRVVAALKNDRKLDILVVGSRSSSISSAESTAYPARLQTLLRDRLPGIAVNVTFEMRVKRTAAEVASGLGQLVADRKPALLIWQTGTYDAIRSIDTDEFRNGLSAGIEASQKAGADVILMNLQYSPRIETMINPAPYLDNMRAVAQEHDVPLFDRFALMRHWNETGEFDLFNPSPGIDLAMRVHHCLARALSTFVIDAAKINPSELRTLR
ncbi:SGNH/GDSL hydrolase family protein [Rhodopseudomonas sp. NSM]|uniref:SGNH/GDSL hydrolase family protein n=1 Tax=Rhodopseudomonas sp. NSM TaxID=3457630 RepID=UPI004036276A